MRIKANSDWGTWATDAWNWYGEQAMSSEWGGVGRSGTEDSKARASIIGTQWCYWREPRGRD